MSDGVDAGALVVGELVEGRKDQTHYEVYSLELSILREDCKRDRNTTIFILLLPRDRLIFMLSNEG